MECDGSIDGRDTLNYMITAKWIDCTGGQSAYQDGNLETFGTELVNASRTSNVSYTVCVECMILAWV